MRRMLVVLLLVCASTSFGQFGRNKASLAPADSAGMLTRSDTSWIAYKSWVEGQGYGTGSGDTTGMLTRTDTSWVATRFALNSYVALSDTATWLPSWADILALHYLLPSDSGHIRNYSDALYALVGHNHDGTYATPASLADSLDARANDYASLEHDHSGVYATPSSVSDSLGARANDYSTVEHDHSGTYTTPASVNDSLDERANDYQPVGTYATPASVSDSLDERADDYQALVPGTGQENYIPKWSEAIAGPVWRPDSVGTGGSGISAETAAGMIADSASARANDYSTIEHDHSGTYQPAGTYLVPSDSTNARTYSSTLYQPIGTYLVPSDSTNFRTYSGTLYQVAGTYLIPSDSASFRTYSGTLYQPIGTYATPASVSDTAAARADDYSTIEHAHTNVYLPIADSANYVKGEDSLTSVLQTQTENDARYAETGTANTFTGNQTVNSGVITVGGSQISDGGYDNATGYIGVSNVYLRSNIYLLNKAAGGWLNFVVRNTGGSEAVADLDYVGTINGQALIATETSVGSIPYMEDATTLGTVTVGGALDMDGATLNLATRTLYSAGLIDSVKTTDTLFVGLVYPAATLSSIVYSSARTCFYKVRLEIVDSLYQTASPTLLDTMSCIYQRNNKGAAVGGGTFSISAGKIVRAVFESVGIMPKQFNVSLVGTN